MKDEIAFKLLLLSATVISRYSVSKAKTIDEYVSTHKNIDFKRAKSEVRNIEEPYTAFTAYCKQYAHQSTKEEQRELFGCLYQLLRKKEDGDISFHGILMAASVIFKIELKEWDTLEAFANS
jgi:hypothetical protein